MQRQCVGRCVGRLARQLAPSLVPAAHPRSRRRVALARARPEKSTDESVQGGLDPYLEIAVPKDQRPINQLAELKNDSLYSWWVLARATDRATRLPWTDKVPGPTPRRLAQPSAMHCARGQAPGVDRAVLRAPRTAAGAVGRVTFTLSGLTPHRRRTPRANRNCPAPAAATRGALEQSKYVKRLAAVYGFFFAFMGGPIAYQTFEPTDQPLACLLSGTIGSLLVVAVLVIRIYLGWSYVGDRLLSAAVPYEETGWWVPYAGWRGRRCRTRRQGVGKAPGRRHPAAATRLMPPVALMQRQCVGRCVGRLARQLAPSLVPAAHPRSRRRVALARARPEKSTDESVQGGLDPYLEIAVPKDQRPINQLAELKNDSLYSWGSLEQGEYVKRLAGVYGFFFAFMGGPIAYQTFEPTDQPLEWFLSGSTGSLLVVAVLVIRIYLGWSYVGDRLLSAAVPYEETGCPAPLSLVYIGPGLLLQLSLAFPGPLRPIPPPP
ncbi:hypothetical protein TSOC_012026 [Tetrabaena socialis]|uniref:Uncharacterized protein n=1 Tax=Tetrabaena socialis TaxID=47790 RepID=A0A2J7ZP68_9CHLO|nr:hypothetical protein TSOC_012026 [Tetrabaena socialis]|eukprot:PNH02065.1 hypothetical protein TSOC_012026 [Tetrabaena socialis]